MINNKPIANPLIILREEFDDWAVLFNPDTGKTYGINPVSVLIWKRLDSKHTISDIVAELREICEDAPEDAEKYVEDFINQLVENGVARYEASEAR